jgi:hypothetical protein
MFTGNLEYVGIDKIRLIYPVHQEYSDGSYDLFTKHKVKKTRGNGVLLDFIGTAAADPRAPIYVELRNHGTEALVEFNPARQMDLEGNTLCHPDMVLATVIWVLQELAYVAMPRFAVDPVTQEILIDDYKSWLPGWMQECRLTRLDLARDFYSSIDNFSISALLQVKKSYYPNDAIYRNNMDVNTISWGSKNTTRCSIYNKSVKHKSTTPKGWYRFEAQAHTEDLKKYGLRTLDGICEIRANSLLWFKWNQCNMGLPISISGGSFDFHGQLSRVLAPRELQMFLGVAYSLAHNLPVGISDRSVGKYRSIGRKIGFNLGDDMTNLGKTKVFIDFTDGLVKELKDSDEFTLTAVDLDANIEHKKPIEELV